jgi:hypothetical protein
MRRGAPLTVRLARAVRRVASLAPLTGLAPAPPRRPEGISALVRVAGEEEWIEPCLLSVAEVADEILVLDNGAAPPARGRIDALARSIGSRLRRFDCTGAELPAVANRGLAESRFRWAFLWDADFVARTEGPSTLGRLKAFLAALDRRRYHLVYVRALELVGDLGHRFPELPDRYDPHVFTAGGSARYVWRAVELRLDRPPFADRLLRDGGNHPRFRARYDTLWTPKYYGVLRWREPCVFHVNVKSARRTLLRHFWLEWLAAAERVSLDEYALRRVQERWDVADLDAAARRFTAEYCRGLERLDPAAIGGYPQALLPYVERAAYRVLYEDGRIVGRAEP